MIQACAIGYPNTNSEDIRDVRYCAEGKIRGKVSAAIAKYVFSTKNPCMPLSGICQ
jgi:hypothetical protein